MATYFGREVLLHQLIEQKKLHRAMFSKIKDRKAKIRKFMIFVNNVLNGKLLFSMLVQRSRYPSTGLLVISMTFCMHYSSVTSLYFARD